MSEVVVVGAGISGLAAAWELQRRGYAVTVLEERAVVGGVIDSGTASADVATASDATTRFTVEWGPNSALGSASTLLRLAKEVQLDPVCAAEVARSRFIVRNGRLRKLPSGPLSLLTSRALSFAGKLRLLREPWQARGDVAHETVAEFFARRCGPELADYVVAPFVSGIYGGLATELEMQSAFPNVARWEREAGSILRGALRQRRVKRAQERDEALRQPRPFTFAGGMAELPRRLAAALGEAVVPSTTVRSIDRRDNGWAIATESKSWGAEHVVVAVPAYAATTLLAASAPALSGELTEIPYGALSVLQVGFERDALQRAVAAAAGAALDGFGFLVPPCESSAILGCIFASRVFPHRAPSGHDLLTIFAGGRGVPQWGEQTEDVQRRRMLDALAQVLGELPSPTFEQLRHLPRAIPQYVTGHGARIERIDAALAACPGLHLAGNYLRGIAIEAAAESGVAAAQAIDS